MYTKLSRHKVVTIKKGKSPLLAILVNSIAMQSIVCLQRFSSSQSLIDRDLFHIFVGENQYCTVAKHWMHTPGGPQ